MKHDFIDKYSSRDSLIHRLDPRIKLVLSLCFLVLLASTNQLERFALFGGLVLVLVVISRVPLEFYFKKLLMITPFTVVISFFIFLSHRLEHPGEPASTVFIIISLLVIKVYLSILVITLLISTTRFNDLLWGLRKYRLPLLVTTLSKLVYTYIFLLVDELHRTLRAYHSRTPVLRYSRFKLYGNITAGIFLRSLERSDLIYKAMVSRGFNGEFPEGNIHHIKPMDFAAVLLFLAMVISTSVLWKI